MGKHARWPGLHDLGTATLPLAEQNGRGGTATAIGGIRSRVSASERHRCITNAVTSTIRPTRLFAPNGLEDSGTDDCAGGIAGLVSLKSTFLVFASMNETGHASNDGCDLVADFDAHRAGSDAARLS